MGVAMATRRTNAATWNVLPAAQDQETPTAWSVTSFSVYYCISSNMRVLHSRLKLHRLNVSSERAEYFLSHLTDFVLVCDLLIVLFFSHNTICSEIALASLAQSLFECSLVRRVTAQKLGL